MPVYPQVMQAIQDGYGTPYVLRLGVGLRRPGRRSSIGPIPPSTAPIA